MNRGPFNKSLVNTYYVPDNILGAICIDGEEYIKISAVVEVIFW